MTADVGDHAVTLRVADSGGLIDTQSFTITVAYINDAPTFTSTPVTDRHAGRALHLRRHGR
jgi:large repetitive protein